jgi:hypothetical protein
MIFSCISTFEQLGYIHSELARVTGRVVSLLPQRPSELHSYSSPRRPALNSALYGYRLRGRLSARPAAYASDPVFVHRRAPLLRDSFRPHLTVTLLRFALTLRPSRREEDLHIQLTNMLGTAMERAGSLCSPPFFGAVTPAALAGEARACSFLAVSGIRRPELESALSHWEPRVRSPGRNQGRRQTLRSSPC